MSADLRMCRCNFAFCNHCPACGKGDDCTCNTAPPPHLVSITGRADEGSGRTPEGATYTNAKAASRGAHEAGVGAGLTVRSAGHDDRGDDGTGSPPAFTTPQAASLSAASAPSAAALPAPIAAGGALSTPRRRRGTYIFGVLFGRRP